MSRSNGATKHGRLHQTEIVTKITLYRKGQLSVCQDRLVQVFANGESLYSPCHNFAKMRREFEAKFGRPIPGVIDNYEGQVRTKLYVDQLVDDLTGEELQWVLKRIVLKDETAH